MEPVLFSVENGVGNITLNRPQSLNALSYDMIAPIVSHLQQWAVDDEVNYVVISGTGERAFCAGGDVKAVFEDGRNKRSGKSDGALLSSFFYDEYRLNALIADFPKPFLAIAQGYVMGGGVGLSLHGNYRVVTDNTVMAMPETGIGLFPDIGAMHMLTRAPGFSGLFAGFTGFRMNAADALYIGYATHYVPENLLSVFEGDILSGDYPVARVEFYNAEIEQASFLKEHQKDIDEIYKAKSLEGLFHNAKRQQGRKIADMTLAAFDKMSPTSLALTFEHYQRAKDKSLHEVLVMDYRLSQFCMQNHDFYEGIRALLVDKDKNPLWDPMVIDKLDNTLINKAFDEVPVKGDLTFI